MRQHIEEIKKNEGNPKVLKNIFNQKKLTNF